MPQRRVTIASSQGLHARPASQFTQAAAACGYAVRIGRDEAGAVDAASILGIMSLGLAQGDDVVLTSDDEGSEGALDDLVALLSRDLDAPANG